MWKAEPGGRDQDGKESIRHDFSVLLPSVASMNKVESDSEVANHQSECDK